MAEPIKTLTINNFGGRLTRYKNGDINSGFAKYATTFGNDPYSSPGKLTWYDSLVQIDPNATVITDLIVSAKERVESGITYLYAIGHTARLYKIQINNPSTFNPNYDNPVLVTTLTINSPTFTRGGFMDFFGTTEKIYIGHDMGVTSINFDGTSEAFVGTLGSWTQTIPRPLRQFVGNLYVSNGSNIVEISSVGVVNTYTKLSPGFPSNTQVRDIDTSIDGTYLIFVVSRLALPNITATTQDTTLLSSVESYVYKWNGSDQAASAFTTFPSFSLMSHQTFGEYEYLFGYDIAGASVFNPNSKIINTPLVQSPLPNATGSTGNFLAWAIPEFVNGFTKMSLFLYGSLDAEVDVGWWRQFQLSATGTETDIISVPMGLIVSGFVLGSSTNGYAGGLASAGKTYFSTLEVSAAPTTKYKLYKFYNVTGGLSSSMAGVYETQSQLFSSRIKVGEIRFYTEPLVANNAFQVDLIGSSGNPIAGSTKTFTAGSGPDSIGNDILRYSPQVNPTHVLGLRITNAGSANMTFNKVEIDYKDIV